ncbi:MAG: protein kinase [Prosthecobacter sp.]|jgi:hypothetical protein|uniref:protein kinase domain-containing protein n=1 Tax=Prosthecobacter sp. TaxID=1965333 RepID=UPI0019FAC3C4|nr:protein kinase [Prosthecobacter sp.]MBE2283347.1 protein kinase [Prosthecobacter sp.]
MNSPASFPCPRCRAPLPSAEAECPACLLSMGADADATRMLAAEKLPERRLQPGEVFGGYRIEQELGRGGMGAVYAATEAATGRRIALKVLSQRLADVESRTRFLREGRVAASINHANSVYIFGTEEIEGRSVIAMELIGGGTLQQRVAEKGPLPVGEAVDAILDIIAGLEAAEAAGVLHRDIKPANCFIDTDGMVKVGDFGLSISTEGSRDLNVTQHGVFLGTPAFCSPEQLRGEPLDVRSDIYAVGVTLYYLLTGQTPFEGANVMQLMANALDKAPRDPAKLRAGLPREIVNVLTRCLAKQAGNRPATYAELKSLLLPFRSTAPTPTSVGLRFASWLLDYLIEAALGLMVSLWLLDASEIGQDIGGWSWGMWASFLFLAGLLIVPQGLWGATIGQALVGLRVVRGDRGAPGLPRAAGRYLILYLPGLVMMLLPLAGATFNTRVLLAYALPVYRLLLFVTIRRRNGYAAVHDLLTGTRVVEKAAVHAEKAAASPIQEPVSAQNASGQEPIGPYQVLGMLEERAEDTLLLGFDPRLLRRVWLRLHPGKDGSPRHPVTRFTRLRWLASGMTADHHWDAYEAPAGTALLQLAREPQPWSVVRGWLHDLAQELEASRREGSLPPTLGLDQLWITAEQRLKVLPFTAPGPGNAPKVQAAHFLNHTAQTVLEGLAVPPAAAMERAAHAPMPAAARAWLNSLVKAAPEVALASLKPLLTMPASVSRLKRAMLLLLPASPSLLMLLGLLVTGPFMEKAREMHARHPQLSEASKVVFQFDTMEMMARFLPPPTDNDPLYAVLKEDKEKARRLLGVLLSSRYGRFVRDEAEWSSSEVKSILIQHHDRVEELVKKHPAPTAAEVAEAERVFAPTLKTVARLESSRQSGRSLMSMQDMVRFSCSLLMSLMFCSLLLTVLLRRSVLPRAFGVDYVLMDGRPAGRARLLWRALLGWLPAFGLALLLMLMKWPLMPGSLIVVCVAGMAALSLWLHSLLRPRRALHDQITGTWPVLA